VAASDARARFLRAALGFPIYRPAARTAERVSPHAGEQRADYRYSASAALTEVPRGPDVGVVRGGLGRHSQWRAA